MTNHRLNDSRKAHEIANAVVAQYVVNDVLSAIRSDEALFFASVHFDVAETAQELCGQYVKDTIVGEANRLALDTLTAIKEAMQ